MSDIAKRLKQLADTIRSEQDNTKKPPKTHSMAQKPECIHKWAERHNPKPQQPPRVERTEEEQQDKELFDINLALLDITDQVVRLKSLVNSNPAFKEVFDDAFDPVTSRLELLERMLNDDPKDFSDDERERLIRMKQQFLEQFRSVNDDFF